MVGEKQEPKNKLEAARLYTSWGWPVHPLSPPTDKGKNPGKRSLLKNWQNRGLATDEELKEWFEKNDYNIGLVCGKRSGVSDLDFDKKLCQPLLFPYGIDTMKSARIEGRGHVFLKYINRPSFKNPELGIELLNDGANAVLPPSVHVEGQIYKWNRMDGKLAELDERTLQILGAVQRYPERKAALRQCFRWMIDNIKEWHGAVGRERMLALTTELKANGGDEFDAQVFACRIYGEDFDSKLTMQEWRNVDAKKPWRCTTLMSKFPDIGQLCKECPYQPTPWGEAKAKKKELPPIPHEEINRTCELEELLTTYKKWLYIQEDYNLIAPICVVLGNSHPGEVDIIGLIGASGSVKTEILRSFGETENQYCYPISSLTEHTFVSGHKDNIDTIPILRGRIIIIKDLTSLLSKKEDIRTAVFADLREITDGYIRKEFGNGVKKEYRNIHSSILFGSTNAIERYYSMYSNLGARMMFIRPMNDRIKAREKSRENQSKLKEMREELHETMMAFLKTQMERMQREGLPELSEKMTYDLGELCDFLAIVRTPIHHNRVTGELDEIPEPEYPTRIYNTVCKLIRIHAFIHHRPPNKEDIDFGIRIIKDNIPLSRMEVLRVLSSNADWQTTAQLSEKSIFASDVIRYNLIELKALGGVEKLSRESKTEKEEDKRSDSFRLKIEWNRLYSLLMQLTPTIRTGDDIDDILKAHLNKHNAIPLESLVSIFNGAQFQWQRERGESINAENLNDFVEWFFIEYQNIDLVPSEIKIIAKNVFKITPEPVREKCKTDAEFFREAGLSFNEEVDSRGNDH